MFIAAIKCDFCDKAHEIPCRKSGDKPDVPEGWATITPMVRIKGTPNDPTFRGQTWDKEKKTYVDGITPEAQKIADKNKLYKSRRDDLRAKFDKSHVCLDCIEEIHTGKRSIKIGMQ